MSKLHVSHAKLSKKLDAVLERSDDSANILHTPVASEPTHPSGTRKSAGRVPAPWDQDKEHERPVVRHQEPTRLALLVITY